MTKMSRKLQVDLGTAIHREWCKMDADETTARRIIEAVSDVLDEHGVDPDLFETAAGWDEEFRTRYRLVRMRRNAPRTKCRRCGRPFMQLSGPSFGCATHGIVEGVRS